MISSRTVAKPDRKAPKMKKGGYIVECHPTVAAAAKPTGQKKPLAPDDEENKGVIDYLKQDVENVGKVLNPFRW